MSYFCVCAFDLDNHATSDDYKNAYADLAGIGFYTRVTGDNGRTVVLPNTTTAGEFTGASAAAVRDALTAKVQAAFKARGFTSEIFVSVGGDWAWGYRITAPQA